jgi:hypothetical protein
LREINAELCVKCKGYKGLCGLPVCPIMHRFRFSFSAIKKIKSDPLSLNGSSPPTIIVGERDYPNVNLYIGIPPEVIGERAKEYDDPVNWWGKKGIDQIISLRSYMLNPFLEVKAEKPFDLYNKEFILSSASVKPVYGEVELMKRPEPRLLFNPFIPPRGPSSPASKIRMENVSLERKLERIIFDDLKANQAVKELYKSIDYYTIIRALSAGLIGSFRRRRLVPTRWAITAVDSIVGKMLAEEVKKFNEISEYLVLSSHYLANRFYVILSPGKLSFTWIEIWQESSIWTERASEETVLELNEDYKGEYDFMDGGYMAARVGVLEGLIKMKRQAKVIIIREITKDYYAPLGNWHIRETVRRAMSCKPSRFYSLRDSLEYVKSNMVLTTDIMKLKSIRNALTEKGLDYYYKK